MLKELTWEEFIDWFHYYELDEFGEKRADLRAGTIASAIYNTNRGKNKSPVKAEHFNFIPKSATTNYNSSTRKRKPLTDPKEFDKLTEYMKVYAKGK